MIIHGREKDQKSVYQTGYFKNILVEWELERLALLVLVRCYQKMNFYSAKSVF